eukprot:TRINITY_DN46574_c0_g1_i1.p1 TRINITY_DN46574_c0_g1~~TRINITY_DN46574_c0_g1_i1.p1  ORF type:complete len:633 (-),score=55.86 TRINITY_DN46574_c0_g1_i1:232-2091(-)
MQHLIDCEIDFHAVHEAFPQAVAGYVRDRACRQVLGAQALERQAVLGARGRILPSSRAGILKVNIETNGNHMSNEVNLQVVGAKVEIREDSILDGLWVAVSCLEAGQQSSWDEAAWLVWPRNVEIRQFMAWLWEAGAIHGAFETQWNLDTNPVFSKTGVDILTATSKADRRRDAFSSHISISNDEQVAVKAMRRPLMGQDAKREVVMLTAVQGHPNVIKFHSLLLLEESENESWGIVQQWCREGDLFNEVINGPCTEMRALLVIADVARGLEHIHSRGVVHRDVKAENVFRLGSACVLGDFGSAAYESDRAEMSKHSGTLGYIAPEMLLRRHSACSYPLDVFSTGVLLYLLLSARLPFGNGRNEEKTCRLSCLASIKYKAPQFDQVSDACKGFLKVMCKGQPSDRPSASTICTVIARLLETANEEGSVASHGGSQSAAGPANTSESVAGEELVDETALPADSIQNSDVSAAGSRARTTQPMSTQGAQQSDEPTENVGAHAIASPSSAAGVPLLDVRKRRPTPYLEMIDGKLHTFLPEVRSTSLPSWAFDLSRWEDRATTESLQMRKRRSTPNLAIIDGTVTPITPTDSVTSSQSWASAPPKGEARASTEPLPEIYRLVE